MSNFHPFVGPQQRPKISSSAPSACPTSEAHQASASLLTSAWVRTPLAQLTQRDHLAPAPVLACQFLPCMHAPHAVKPKPCCQPSYMVFFSSRAQVSHLTAPRAQARLEPFPSMQAGSSHISYFLRCPITSPTPGFPLHTPPAAAYPKITPGPHARAAMSRTRRLSSLSSCSSRPETP